MTQKKLAAGSDFPVFELAALKGGTVKVGTPQGDSDWQVVVVYRGKHCPICTRYLTQLNELLPQINALGVDVVAISADTKEKASAQCDSLELQYSVGFGMSVDQMRKLGVYISDPRSAEETDRPFSEPGLFVINDSGKLQVTDISNAPFARPDLASLVMGLGFIRNPDNQYPIRGTHSITG